jgi:hypothetical protein
MFTPRPAKRAHLKTPMKRCDPVQDKASFNLRSPLYFNLTRPTDQVCQEPAVKSVMPE